MASTTCGWCNEKVHMTPAGPAVVRPYPLRTYHHDDNEKYVVDAAYTCDSCHRLSVVSWVTGTHPDVRRMEGHDDGPGSFDSARWSPTPGHQKEFPDVPDQIAQAAQEAWLCHVAGAHRGAVAVARAVVEATAKAKGHVKGQVVDKIEALANAGEIRPAVKDQAHEIRHLGNSVAHGDLGDPVTAEDAAEILELMGEVLNEVFQSPARGARLKAAREARRAGSSGSRAAAMKRPTGV